MIQALPRSLYDRAKRLKIFRLHLRFSGGWDEGDLYVSADYDNFHERFTDRRKQFLIDVENWAWEAYSYSGAGDGDRYGDNIIYNFRHDTVSHDEWFMERAETNHAPEEMRFDEDLSDD